MYDLSRIRGVAGAATVVLAGLGLLSGLAQATLSGRPAWLPAADTTMEAGQDAVVARRIAGAVAQMQNQSATATPDLGIVLGGSAVGMGIDPLAMEAAGDPRLPGRWLSLYANGGTTGDFRDFAELLFASGLRFRTLVLGIHPGLIAESKVFLDDARTIDLRDLRRELAARHLVAVKDKLQDVASVSLNWFFPNRRRISGSIRARILPIKQQLFARLGVTVNGLFAADRDPWKVNLLIPDPEEPTRQAAAEGRAPLLVDPDAAAEVKDLKAWTNPAAYSPDNGYSRALVDTVREAQRRKIEVIIVVLPEATIARNSLPPVAMQTLRIILDRAFATAAPPVIDLLDALRDDQFHDTIHPNRSGRIETTDRLIRALKQLPAPQP